MSASTFFERLEAARSERGTVLCVGIDPRLDRIPAEIQKAAGGDPGETLRRFGLELLDLVREDAACVKVQVAFFEALGLKGLQAYAAILAQARRRGIPVIADVKRGDIGSTAEAYAAGHLAKGGDLEADAITANPYLGADALQPFVAAAKAAGKGVYVLVRTSNPGAKDLQEIAVEGGRVFERVADLVERLDGGGARAVGAVVGATAPEAGRRLRARMPSTPFLVPGYGAQGASADDVAACLRPDGGGIVVNASRSVIDPPGERGLSAAAWREAVARAARRAREELHGVAVRA
jgi:orotidine-5'-phosphate decarboxylase